MVSHLQWQKAIGKIPEIAVKKVKEKRVSSKEKLGNKTTNNVISSVFFDYKEKKMYRDILA